MDPTVLPPAIQEHVRAFLRAGGEPAEPRLAATTILLRPGPDGGPEVFLQRRHTGMAFAPDVAVFPGGGVDRRDIAEGADLRWVGPPAAAWGRRLGVDDDVARAVVCAAARELFEESGVLLAGDDPDTVVSSVTGLDWDRDRDRLEARETSLSGVLRERRLALRSDLLGLWSCWLTPEFEPRRYRTWFFVALLPAGQETQHVSSESVEASWTPVGEALRAADGPWPMLPPQYCTTAELHGFVTPADVLAAAEERPARAPVPTITPTAAVEGDDVRLGLPDDVLALARRGGART